jgi:uncharacterized protein with HEPN domain
MARDESYLLDILKAGRKLIRITSGMSRASFEQNDVVQDSAIRQIEIIGEAAKKVSSGFKETHPEIPWREMVGMRNRLIHDYWRIDIEQVWKTIQEGIPALIRQIEPLVPSED